MLVVTTPYIAPMFLGFDPLVTGPDITLSNMNLTASNTSNFWNTTLHTIDSYSTGKRYFEIDPGAGSLAQMVGIIADPSPVLNTHIGVSAVGYAYHSGGSSVNNDVFSGYGASYNDADFVGVAADFDANQLEFFKNGVSQGTLAIGAAATYFAAYSIDNMNDGTINVGATAFNNTIPVGYMSWDGSQSG